MIISKLIGGALLLVSALMIYLRFQHQNKKKTSQIEGFIKLISYIKNQIECYMIPIDRILFLCDKEVLYECGYGESVPPQSLKTLINNINPYMNNEASSIINRFANEFGTSYSNEQIRSCERCINELKKIKEVMNDKNARDKRVQLAICVCVSFSIIIILM